MALVSIITPSWNVAPLIGETIASVQAQTMTDWELLIADDCSTDQTAAIVESHAAQDPRVKLIRQPRNGGPALARQAAIEQAQGRFIAFLDSDDLWLPAKLERQIAFAQAKRAALSYTAFRRINETGSVTGRLIEVPASLNYEQLLKNTSIATLTALVDRDVAGNIAMKNEPYDDFCLWLAMGSTRTLPATACGAHRFPAARVDPPAGSGTSTATWSGFRRSNPPGASRIGARARG